MCIYTLKKKFKRLPTCTILVGIVRQLKLYINILEALYYFVLTNLCNNNSVILNVKILKYCVQQFYIINYYILLVNNQ